MTLPFRYETGNNIKSYENGYQKNLDADHPSVLTQEGEYSYDAQDGTHISVKYIADENGFRPVGAHLPVAPQPAEQQQRQLAQNPPQVAQLQQQLQAPANVQHAQHAQPQARAFNQFNGQFRF